MIQRLLAGVALLCLPVTAMAIGVNLAWVYDAEIPVIGWSVYRQQNCTGPWIRQNTEPIPPLELTEWTDTTVTVGQTYCYQVKAYNDVGEGPASQTLQFFLQVPAAAQKLQGKVVP